MTRSHSMTRHFSRCLIPLAIAQIFVNATAAANVLEEVVVTAQKRSESSQDVAISIAVLNSASIAEVRDLNDLIALVPNVSLTGFSQNQNTINIRGVGSGDDGAAGDAATAVHYDGIFISRDGARDILPFDLARVEILRGPQGTLYGKNAVAGAVNYIPNRPDKEFDAAVQFTAGAYDLFELRGMVNGALGDNVNGRLAVNVTERDGYFDNILTGNDLGNIDNQAIRGGLRFAPSDTLEVYLGADYSTDDARPSGRKLDPDYGDKFLPIPFIRGIPNSTSDIRKVEVNTDGHFERDIAGVTLEVNKDFGGGVITWLSGYRDLDYSTSYDLDGSAQDWLVQNIDETSDQVSTELRFTSAPADTGSFEYVAGLFYMSVDTDRHEFNDFYTGMINPAAPGTPPIDTRISWDQQSETDSMAAFAEMKYVISNALSLRLGARYSKEEKHFEMVTSCGNQSGVLFTRGPDIPFPPFQTGGPGLAGTCIANVNTGNFNQAIYSAVASKSWDNFSGKLGLEYTPNEDALLYATYSQGFKSGGFPPSGTTQKIAETEFDEETADNFELGLKSTLLDGQAILNVAVFYTDYSDLQVGVLDPITGALFVENAADATSKGLEVDLSYAPNDVLRLFASYGYTDATYDEFIIAGQDASGEPLRSPKNSANLRSIFDWPVANGNLSFMAEVNYKDEYYQLPLDERQLFPSRTIINSSLGYVTEDGKWEFSIWGRNLSDEDEVVQTIPPPGGLSARLYGAPRTFGATVNWRL
jgi:iron complex outermembrane receptor protein